MRNWRQLLADWAFARVVPQAEIRAGAEQVAQDTSLSRWRAASLLCHLMVYENSCGKGWTMKTATDELTQYYTRQPVLRK